MKFIILLIIIYILFISFLLSKFKFYFLLKILSLQYFTSCNFFVFYSIENVFLLNERSFPCMFLQRLRQWSI